MNKTIALTNQKGGVAKSTTCVNLGIGLANLGKKVLLVDCDPQASLTVSLGYKDTDNLPVTLTTYMEAVMEDKPPLDAVGILHHKEGVDLLPSNIELSGLESKLFNTINREHVLKNVLAPFKEQYDYILLDCMPSLGMLNINTLVAADSVIIPSQPSFLSTKGLDLLIRSMANVRRRINPSLKADGILLTMVDGRTNHAKSIIQSLRTTVGQNLRVFRTEIPFSVRAAECSVEGKSIFTHDPHGKVAAAYESLAQEVCSYKRSRQKNEADRIR